jgi:hypothetical protein
VLMTKAAVKNEAPISCPLHMSLEAYCLRDNYTEVSERFSNVSWPVVTTENRNAVFCSVRHVRQSR